MEKCQWVVCRSGNGKEVLEGKVGSYETHFAKDSVGMVKIEDEDNYTVWLIGTNSTWIVKKGDVENIDVCKTGDRFSYKICNICHCLKPVDSFDINQNNKKGSVRRPSCKKCRTDIDKRAPNTKQAEDMERNKPKTGDSFQCPICRKRSIVGVTAKIVADHDHHTGNIRDFICDSCNTGLGRFKNGEDYLMNAVTYIKDRDTLKH